METTAKRRDYTLEEVNAALAADWIERDSGTFVYSEEERTGNGPVSESLLPDGGKRYLEEKEPERKLRRAHSLARSLVASMGTGRAPRIVFRHDTERSCTDGFTIQVGTQVFDETAMPEMERLDAFLGLAMHEALHLRHTDFTVHGGKDKLLHSLLNIIEDERIEHEGGKSGKGYGKLMGCLAATKRYVFDIYRKKVEKDNESKPAPYHARLLNAILSIVRFPVRLSDEEKVEFGKYLVPVREVLSEYPESTLDAKEMAERIRKIIDEAIENEPERPDGGGNGDDSDRRKNDPETQKRINDLLEKMAEALEEALEQAGKECGAVKRDNRFDGKIAGTVEAGETSGTLFLHHDPERRDGQTVGSVYASSLSRVRRYVAPMRAILQANSEERVTDLRGTRNGQFDSYKLADAWMGSPTVYRQSVTQRSDNITVCVLIDESGSMRGAGETVARDTAVLLNEALGSLSNVSLHIYGHTASGGKCLIYVYREGTKGDRKALGTTAARAGNRDGTVIKEVAARVRRTTGDEVLMFVVSDGAPNESTSFVKNCVREAERNGVRVFGISIDPQYDPSEMYGRNVNLAGDGHDLSRLPLELGKLIKREILRRGKK